MDGSDPAILVVDDLADLVALDKALREAKFSSAPTDMAVAASPLVADLSRRVRAALHAQTLGTSAPPDKRT